jgi:hypothetical protein
MLKSGDRVEVHEISLPLMPKLTRWLGTWLGQVRVGTRTDDPFRSVQTYLGRIPGGRP